MLSSRQPVSMSLHTKHKQKTEVGVSVCASNTKNITFKTGNAEQNCAFTMKTGSYCCFSIYLFIYSHRQEDCGPFDRRNSTVYSFEKQGPRQPPEHLGYQKLQNSRISCLASAIGALLSVLRLLTNAANMLAFKGKSSHTVSSVYTLKLLPSHSGCWTHSV